MADRGVTRRLAAVLAADVAGYTRLMEQDTAGTVAAWQAARDDVIDPTVAAHSGRMVKLTGDGFLVEFPTIQDAVECAIALQDGLRANVLDFRMGINLGDIVDDGRDIHGEGVNVAARLEGLAEPGGIRVSGDVFNQVRNRIDAVFEDLGEKEVKHVSAPVRVYAIRLGGGAEAGLPEEGPGPETPKPEKSSIAVLPFDNMSGDPAQDFIGDGLSEDIITALSRIRLFFVIARNSTFTYKGLSPDVRQVARDLGVRYVLEGSVRRAGDRLRITMQLIDGSSGNHIWAEKYDRQFEDLFQVQDEITQTIVAQLEPELGRAEYERVKSEPTGNLDAWALFHRGIQHIFRRTRDDILQARGLFEQAIERDPSFASAHAGKAWTYAQDALLDISASDREVALRAAEKAIELDDRDHFAHIALGQALPADKQNEDAISAYREAIRINPSCALAHSLLGMSLTRSGRAEEAIPHALLAIRLSPSDPGIGPFYGRLSAAHFYLGQHDEAVEWGRKALRKGVPWPGRVYMTAALGHLERPDEARQACENLQQVRPDITVAFVRQRIPAVPEIHMEGLLEGLRKAGLPEG